MKKKERKREKRKEEREERLRKRRGREKTKNKEKRQSGMKVIGRLIWTGKDQTTHRLWAPQIEWNYKILS